MEGLQKRFQAEVEKYKAVQKGDLIWAYRSISFCSFFGCIFKF